MTLMIFY